MNAQFNAKRKWVIIGGSYPGALSAWFKSKYSTHVEIAWSSSGVINAIRDYKGMDFDVIVATSKSSKECTSRIKDATEYIDILFTNGTSEEKMLLFAEFNTTLYDIDRFDFMYMIADVFTGPVQQGDRVKMCEFIESDQFDDRVKGVAKLADMYGLTLDGYDSRNLRNTTVDINKAGRQWAYQFCHEFGFFQTPNFPFTIRSHALDDPFWIDYCKRIFNNATYVDNDATNAYYGGLDI